MMNALDSTSTRPYLIRALYEWCTDNGLTPYIAVLADDTVQVPREHVRNGEIVLNISFDATSALKLGNEFVEFKARFGGIAREIIVPINRVLAIYARENGQGMAFPVAVPSTADDPTSSAADQIADASATSHGPIQLVPRGDLADDGTPPTAPPPSPKPKRPSLKVVK
ncbi:MAG: ClpXP protease specificity-enhancing factor [Burkholderiaceae bacterium]|jgi:stringent starvation protein B|nr:ClpXP protease specificity-enhancing factor [Burkholderiaceae bacterium]